MYWLPHRKLPRLRLYCRSSRRQGTNTLMLDVFQLVTGAANPLNVTVFVAACVSPKFTPAIVTEKPTGADDGEIPVIAGVTEAVNFPTNALRALFKLNCRNCRCCRNVA